MISDKIYCFALFLHLHIQPLLSLLPFQFSFLQFPDCTPANKYTIFTLSYRVVLMMCKLIPRFNVLQLYLQRFADGLPEVIYCDYIAEEWQYIFYLDKRTLFQEVHRLLHVLVLRYNMLS